MGNSAGTRGVSEGRSPLCRAEPGEWGCLTLRGGRQQGRQVFDHHRGLLVSPTQAGVRRRRRGGEGPPVRGRRQFFRPALLIRSALARSTDPDDKRALHLAREPALPREPPEASLAPLPPDGGPYAAWARGGRERGGTTAGAGGVQWDGLARNGGEGGVGGERTCRP